MNFRELVSKLRPGRSAANSRKPADSYRSRFAPELFVDRLEERRVLTAPVIALPGSAVDYNENASPTVIDGTATVIDDSADFDTGTLTVSITANGTANDRLAIRDEGAGAGNITVNGPNVEYDFGMGGGSEVIGTIVGGTGLTPLVVTFNSTANVEAAEALMRNITYENVSDDPSTMARTVQFVLNDGDMVNGGDSNAETETINVNAFNDDPAITITGGSVSYNENDPATIIDGGATLTDPDSADFDGGTLTVSFSANGTANDQLAINNEGTASGQISVSGSDVQYNFGGGAMTIGTFAGGANGADLVITLNATSDVVSVQALLRNITYENTSDDPSEMTRTAQFVLTDGDGGTSAAATRDIDVTASNDDPAITLTGGSVNFNEGDSPVLIDNLAALSDPDSANFDTGVLTISFTMNGTANDQLAINNEGTASGQISISGSNVQYNFGGGAMTIGTFAGGANGANLVITLNATSDVVSVQALLRNITFENTSNSPSELTRTVQFVLTDGDGGTSNMATRTVTVANINDAPVITLTGGAVNYNENDPATIIDNGAVLTDADSANFDTGVLTISFSANGTANDQLAIQAQPLPLSNGEIGLMGNQIVYDPNSGGNDTVIGTFAGGVNGADLVITFDADADIEAVQALLRVITYQNTSNAPSELTRTVQFVMTDGDGGTSTAATRDINVTASNDDPAITLTGGNVSYTENDPATIIDGGATLTDADSADFDTGVLTISFSANGTTDDQLAIRDQGINNGEISVSGNQINYNPIAGSLVTIGTFAGGVNGANLVITLNANADVEAVQALLRNITFENTSDDPSTMTRTVQFVMTDGDGGTSNMATRDIDVAAANDDPAITLTGGNVGYNENDPATIIDGGATLTDADSADFDGGTLTVSFSANGTANDQLAINNQGTNPGEISISGSNVRYNFGGGAMTIGTFAGGANGADLVITLNSTSDVVSVQALLRNITFENTSETPSELLRTVQFVLTDGDGGTSNMATRDIDVTAFNDDPTITLTGGAVSYDENDPATIIDGGAMLTDPDSPDFDTGVLTISFSANGTTDDQLAINNQGTNPGQIGVAGGNVTYNFGGGAMIIGTFAGGANGTNLVITLNATSDVTSVQALLRNITFENTSETPSELLRTVQFVLTDGDGGTSNMATRDIDVNAINDDPVITLTGGAVNYVENNPPLLIDNLATLADVDSTDFDGGTLTISFTLNGTADDQLAINDEGTGNGQISLSGGNVQYNFGGGAMTIGTFAGGVNGADLVITLNGTSDVASVQQLLRNITFENTSDNPSILPRTVQFELDDGDGGSDAATRTVTVTAANDDPLITLSGGTASFTEGNSPVLIDDMALLVDPDSLNFDGGTLTISLAANGTVYDQLAIFDAGPNPGNGEIGLNGNQVIFDPMSGGDVTIGTFAGGVNGADLVISLNSDADLEAVIALLQNITFENTSNNPSTLTRTVQFVLTDGDGGTSNAATRDVDVIAVNDDPILTLTGGTVNFTENNPPIVIDDMASLADPDSPDFDGGTLTISFAANGTATDQLAIRDQGAGVGNISLNGSDVRYDFGAGPVVIGTFAGGMNGADLVITLNANSDDASVEALMRNITFENPSENPSVLDRTVQFVLTDGDGGTSNAATRDVTVTVANDQPAVSTNTGAMVNEGGTVQITMAMLEATDPDDAPGGLTYTVTAIGMLRGTLFNGMTALNLGDMFTQADVNGGMISYMHDGSETTAASFDFSLADGGEDGSVAVLGTFNFMVTPVNDPPTIPTVPGAQIIQEDTPTILGAIAVDDPEASLFGLNVRVTLSVSNGTLFFTDLTGVNDMGTNGSSTVIVEGTTAALNLILDNNLQYTPDQDFELDDTLTIDVSDLTHSGIGGELFAMQESVLLDIQPVNDPPVANPVMDSVLQDETKMIPLDATDVDMGDVLTFFIMPATVALPPGVVIAPLNAGTFVNNNDGTFTFNPMNQFDALALGAQATITFDYFATDLAMTASNVSTVTIVVTGENDDPEIKSVTMSPATSNEGSPVEVIVKFEDKDVGDTHTIEVSWGDSSPNTIQPNGMPFTHTYVDDLQGGAYTISATVEDNHNSRTEATTTNLVVNNVNPVFTSLETSDVSAIGFVTVTGVFSDAGVADTWEVIINWGDGTETKLDFASRQSFQETHTYIGNPGASPSDDIKIEVTVNDDDGGSVNDSVSASVPGQGLQAPILQTTTPLTNLAVTTPPAAPIVSDDSTLIGQVVATEIQTSPSGPAAGQYEQLVLRRVLPNGEEDDDVLLHDKNDPDPLAALKNLKQTLSNLPPDHYRIYLIREDGTERLVLDIVLKRQLKKQKPEDVDSADDQKTKSPKPKLDREVEIGPDGTSPKAEPGAADKTPTGGEAPAGPGVPNPNNVDRLPMDGGPQPPLPAVSDAAFEPVSTFDEAEQTHDVTRRAAAVAGLVGWTGVSGARAWRKQVRDRLELIGREPNRRARRRGVAARNNVNETH